MKKQNWLRKGRKKLKLSQGVCAVQPFFSFHLILKIFQRCLVIGGSNDYSIVMKIMFSPTPPLMNLTVSGRSFLYIEIDLSKKGTVQHSAILNCPSGNWVRFCGVRGPASCVGLRALCATYFRVIAGWTRGANYRE